MSTSTMIIKGLDFAINLKNVQYAPLCSNATLRYDATDHNYYAWLGYNDYLNRASSYRLYLSNSSTQLIQPANLVNTYIPDWAYYTNSLSDNYRIKNPLPCLIRKRNLLLGCSRRKFSRHPDDV